MKRVMVVGGPGSGKSAFAVSLGDITGLPVFHMDQLHDKPGRVSRDQAERIRLANAVEARPRWIFEGGLSGAFANRCARADTAIWLDLPVGLRLRPEFLTCILRTRNPAREKIAQAIAQAPHLTVHHLRSAKGVRTLLDWIRIDHQNHD